MQNRLVRLVSPIAEVSSLTRFFAPFPFFQLLLFSIPSCKLSSSTPFLLRFCRAFWVEAQVPRAFPLQPNLHSEPAAAPASIARGLHEASLWKREGCFAGTVEVV